MPARAANGWSLPVGHFAGDPVPCAKHDAFTRSAGNSGNRPGFGGSKNGLTEFDNVSLCLLKPGAQPGWESACGKLPKFTPVAGKTEPKKKAAEGNGHGSFWKACYPISHKKPDRRGRWEAK